MIKEETKEKVKKAVETREDRWFEEEYDTAVNDDPNGVICDICGEVNDCFDDMGWFYMPGPICEKCFRGRPGKEWRKRYGTGDR